MGKHIFLQKLGLHNFFGEIVETESISGIEISKTIEAEIPSCFGNEVEFYNASSPDDLKKLIETVDSVENDDVNINDSVYGENKIMDRLILMDNVSGIADCCKEFADFLTVSRKYRYHCVYVFHIIIHQREIWRKIISQTNIFNIFPCSVP